MSTTRNIKNRAATARGSARKTAGRVTGNRRQQAKGRREQAMGNFRQAMAKIMNAFRR
jgi:uncharacterized protein YjbJ (UPF0337 family)